VGPPCPVRAPSLLDRAAAVPRFDAGFARLAGEPPERLVAVPLAAFLPVARFPVATLDERSAETRHARQVCCV